MTQKKQRRPLKKLKKYFKKGDKCSQRKIENGAQRSLRYWAVEALKHHIKKVPRINVRYNRGSRKWIGEGGITYSEDPRPKLGKGIYFLTDEKGIAVYVGMSSACMMKRINAHVNNAYKIFDNAYCLSLDLPQQRLLDIEAAYMSVLRPHYNKSREDGHLFLLIRQRWTDTANEYTTHYRKDPHEPGTCRLKRERGTRNLHLRIKPKTILEENAKWALYHHGLLNFP